METESIPFAATQAPAGQNGGPPNSHSLEHDRVDLNVPRARLGVIFGIVIFGGLVLVALVVVGIIPRHKTAAELAANVEAINGPTPVTVVSPHRADASIDVILPGTLRPWQECSIYSRSSGYLKKYNVDISEQVKKGDVMAIVSSPEIDQQLEAAKATLELQKATSAKAKTALDFAVKTNERYQSLRGTPGITQFELDQYQNNADQAKAAFDQAVAQVGVAEAQVRQLSEMQSFEKLIAPFSGVVTGRAYDVGSFMIANPTTNDILPMFKLAENDVLRAFVNVPQSYALMIKKGMEVVVTSRETGDRKFTGRVLGTTNYLDPNVRSLLTEVRIENPDFALLPGMFVNTLFHVTRESPPLTIPGPAIITNADGNQVAVVKNNKVHFQKVALGVDYGATIEILGGLTGDEQIVGNPGEKIVEGAEVTAANGDKPQPQAVAGTQSSGDKAEKVAEVSK